MKTLLDFQDTSTLIGYIRELLSYGEDAKTKHAGKLWEDYSHYFHFHSGEYEFIYNTNEPDTIPAWVKNKVGGGEVLFRANSFGIDKIAVTFHKEIDVMQDKSSIHHDKNMSATKCAGMMSLRNNGLTNIRNFILNTTSTGLSHYADVWTEQKPIVFSYGFFVPDEFNHDAQDRDKALWDFIHDSINKKTVVTPITTFVSRGPEQDDYIEKTVTFLRSEFRKKGEAKGYDKGPGALGKGVLDPVILARIENELWEEAKEQCGSNVRISISCFHSTKTIAQNGLEEINRRRGEGQRFRALVVSGTEIVAGEGKSSGSTDQFECVTSVSKAVKIIKECNDQGIDVLILTLYHHAPIIEKIYNDLKIVIPGFKKFLTRRRDECDWPGGNKDIVFAPLMDDRTPSVFTFGSSGTERFGKDPINDYGCNNINIHGPKIHEFSWADAENKVLVKPLQLICPIVKVSDMIKLFPEFVDEKTGKVDLKSRVAGKTVDKVPPTIEQILMIAAVATSLVKHPNIKRMLMFAAFVKNNELVRRNWAWVCSKVLGKSKLENEIKKLHITVLNDDAYNINSHKNRHDEAIAFAKLHERSVIGSCRLFGRGWTDKPTAKARAEVRKNWKMVHAGFHIDPRSEVNLIQEIWRIVRLDANESDPNAYYILPIIYNDMDIDEPTYSELTRRKLIAILRNNKNIEDWFESNFQTGSGKRAKTPATKERVWFTPDFDPSLLKNLIKDVGYDIKKAVYFEGIADQIHEEYTTLYIEKKAYFGSRKVAKEIHSQIRSNPKYKDFFEFYPSETVYRSIIRGDHHWLSSTSRVRAVDFEFSKSNLFSKETADIQQMYEKQVSSQLEFDNTYSNTDAITNKYPTLGYMLGDIIEPIKEKYKNNKKHYDKNKRKVYGYLMENAQQFSKIDDLMEQCVKDFPSLGISTYGVGKFTISKNFVTIDNKRGQGGKWRDVLSKKEQEQFLETYNELSARARSKAAVNRPPVSKKTKQKLRIIGKKQKGKRQPMPAQTKLALAQSKLKQMATPLGIFDSVNDAAAAHQVTPSTIGYYRRKYPTKFYII